MIDVADMRLIIQFPAISENWDRAAQALIKAKSVRPAVTYFKRSHVSAPPKLPDNLYRFAMALELAGDYASAAEQYVSVAASDPTKNREATYRAIGCLQRINRLEQIARLTEGTGPADWQGFESMFSVVAFANMGSGKPAAALRWVCHGAQVEDKESEHFRVAATIVEQNNVIEGEESLRDLLVSCAERIFAKSHLSRLILRWAINCDLGAELLRLLVSRELIVASNGKCLQTAAPLFRDRNKPSDRLLGAQMALVWDPLDRHGIQALVPDDLEFNQFSIESNKRWSKAAILAPTTPEHVANQAVIVHKIIDEGETTTRYILRAAKRFLSCPPLLYNAGSYLNEKSLAEQAEPLLRRAVMLTPDYAKALSSLSVSLSTMNEGAKAVRCSQFALSSDPDLESGFTNLAMAYRCVGDIEQAKEAGLQQIRRAPNDAIARMGVAFNQLTLGAIEQGFENYRHRWAQKKFPSMKRPFPQKEWTLQKVPKDKKVLIYMEQGMGDELMFSWFLQFANRAAPGQLVVEADNRLLPVFRRTFPDIEFLPLTTPVRPRLLADDILYKVPIGHLPSYFTDELRRVIKERWEIATQFPVRGYGWIKPDEQEQTAWRSKLADYGSNERLTVGVAWRSGTTNRQRGRQYVTPEELSDALPDGCLAINLQYVYEDSEREEIERRTARRGITFVTLPDLDLKDDLDDVINLCSVMDVIVTPLTSTAFMGGTLGVPTWVFRCSESRTTWHQLGTPHIPWLPSIHLFFRTPWESWAGVIDQTRSGLMEHRDWLLSRRQMGESG